MVILLADTFIASLARLTGEEQKAVKTTAFDLQMNPATGAPGAPARWGGSPGMRLHRLDRAKDRNFWSVRVSGDIRLIVHRTDGSLLLCYVDHHDAAYAWAERRKLERHPTTGAAQVVEVRETVRGIEVPVYVEAPTTPVQPPPKPRLFEGRSDDELLGYGVPAEWLDDVRGADEDSILQVADHLPGEAAEALLELATGGTPKPRPESSDLAIAESPDGFAHPDAQRRFRLMATTDELQRALDAPWDAWTVFLHPDQQDVVSRRHGGPARVAGSAGTGKTIVALHRAVRLAREHPESKVLLATFSDTLARMLEQKLRRLAGPDEDVMRRIDVRAIDRVGLEACQSLEAGKGSGAAPIRLVDEGRVRELLQRASDDAPQHRFTRTFLETEWRDVVDEWQLGSWEAYRDVARLGRKTRLGEAQRAALWAIFERVRADLAAEGVETRAGAFARATTMVRERAAAGQPRPYDHVVVDEAQDIGVSELRFLAALASDRPDGLFFAGDLGQRIFQTPFSWFSLGVDVRGRSHTLRLNYRTSHQIRRQADRLLAPELSDVDGNTEVRTGTVSAFNGPEPEVRLFESVEEEAAGIGAWLRGRAADGVAPSEMAVFVRSEAELGRARAGVAAAGLEACALDGQSDPPPGAVAICSMHLAKGLEFRAVVVAACDDEVVPLQSRIEAVGDEADLEDVYDTERHLLYVACTRARGHLMVAGLRPGSEFLGDLGHRPDTVVTTDVQG